MAIETDLTTKKTAARDAKTDHEKRTKELDAGASPENKERADDLDEWGTVLVRQE